MLAMRRGAENLSRPRGPLWQVALKAFHRTLKPHRFALAVVALRLAARGNGFPATALLVEFGNAGSFRWTEIWAQGDIQ